MSQDPFTPVLRSILASRPAHWDVARFGVEFTESDERNGHNPIGPMLSVSSYRGVEFQSSDAAQRPSANVSHYRVVRPGQLATNMMWLNFGGLAVSELAGYISPAYKAFWISDRVYGRFAHYLLRSRTYVETFASLGQGVRPNSQMVASALLSMLPLLLPPLDEQRRIADYLDRETAEIDAMDAELDRLIETLRERRTVAIRTLFQGFPTMAMGYHCRIVNGSTPLRSRPDFWTTDNGTPWLNSAAVNNVLVTEAPRQVTAVAMKECHLPKVAVGDLLIGITGQGRTRGMVALSGLDCTISQHLAAIQPWSGWDTRFLYYALAADYLELRQQSEGAGSTKGAITCGMLSQYRAPLPSTHQEQRRIVAELDEQTARIDDMIADANRLKGLLAERRSTLITEVVTGKKEVPA